MLIVSDLNVFISSLILTLLPVPAAKGLPPRSDIHFSGTISPPGRKFTTFA